MLLALRLRVWGMRTRACAAFDRTMLYLFYRSYRLSTAVKFFIFRRILPAGWMALIAAVIVSTMLMGSPISPLYQAFSLVVCLTSVALLWAFSRRARLSATREVPAFGSVDQPIRYQVMVEGSETRDCRFQETLPDPRPSWENFALSREPGEAQRNGFDRFSAFNRWQWLLDKRKLFQGGDSLGLVSTKAEGKTRVSMEITPKKRGMIELNDLRVLLPDPFHFFQRARKVTSPSAHIAILPRRYRLPALRLPGEAQFQAGDDATSRQHGSSGEFTSLREYRLGDPPRLIHWKSWAKTGRPIIKEVEDVFFPRYALVLDTFAQESSELAFEEAVSVAASFVSEIDTEQSMLDLMFLGDSDQVITAGKGMADSVKLLEALAAVDFSESENFEQLTRLILRHRADLSACICVFTGWSQSRLDFLRGLQSQGLACVAVGVLQGTETELPPGDVARIHVTQVQEDLLKMTVGR